MVDQDGHHPEMITQLLRHVKSSPHDVDVKGDICQTYCLPSKSRRHSFNILGVTKGEGELPSYPIVEDQNEPGQEPWPCLNRVKLQHTLSNPPYTG